MNLDTPRRRIAELRRRKEIHLALQRCFERLVRDPGDAEALNRLVRLLEQIESADELEEFCARANHAPASPEDGG